MKCNPSMWGSGRPNSAAKVFRVVLEVGVGGRWWHVRIWRIKKKSKSGTTPYPRGASGSAPPKERKEGGQRRATRDEGGKARGRKQLCTRPAANTRSPVGTAASATDAPTKRT
jgi:hypothetical protein